MFNYMKLNRSQRVLEALQFKKLVANHTTGTAKAPVVKFFNPVGSATWYISELDPETGVAFGFVTGMVVDERGYVDLNELVALQGTLTFGMSIERDLHWSGTETFEELGAAA